jgi:hypothetical protein
MDWRVVGTAAAFGLGLLWICRRNCPVCPSTSSTPPLALAPAQVASDVVDGVAPPCDHKESEDDDHEDEQKFSPFLMNSQGARASVDTSQYTDIGARPMGSGTYGQVFAAKCRSTGDQVVIKVMDGAQLSSGSIFANPNNTTRLLREV